MIPTLLLLAGVVAAAVARQAMRPRYETHVGDYEPDSTQLAATAQSIPEDTFTATFDLIGPVNVSTEAEFMAVGDKFEGQGQNMTANDSQKLLEMMFWASKKGWG